MSDGLGRYVLSELLAAGGMSSVYLGRMRGPAGFGRTVAIKQLHPQFARDPEFVAMMLEEARLVSRIHHPNVVPTLDVLHTDRELYLVLDYVAGETLASLFKLLQARGEQMPLPIVRAVASNFLLGLHAAHEARDAAGVPLEIVHRDVSPQNVMLGEDGVARVLDFGIAKAVGLSHQSEASVIKGKVAYMAPEQLRGGPINRTTDVYASAVVLWEMATGQRLFARAEKSQIPFLVTSGGIRAPKSVEPRVPEDLDEIVMRGLDPEPQRRYPTARALAQALEETGPLATSREVADWLADIAREPLAARAARVAALEQDPPDVTSVRALATSLARGGDGPTGAAHTVAAAAPPTPSVAPASAGSSPSRARLLAVVAIAIAISFGAALAAAVRGTAAPLPSSSSATPAKEAPLAEAPSSASVTGPAILPGPSGPSASASVGATSSTMTTRPAAKRPPSQNRPALVRPSSTTDVLFDRN